MPNDYWSKYICLTIFKIINDSIMCIYVVCKYHSFEVIENNGGFSSISSNRKMEFYVFYFFKQVFIILKGICTLRIKKNEYNMLF